MEARLWDKARMKGLVAYRFEARMKGLVAYRFDSRPHYK
jgi:hypothetical protein